MMKISTSTFGVIRSRGLEPGMKALADAGFEAIDYSMTQNALRWDEGFLRDASLPEFAEHFRSLGKTIRSCGLEIHQGHTPYQETNCDDYHAYPLLLEHSIRSIYAAGYMEIPFMVAHPVTHPDFCGGRNRERARQLTLDYFSAMVPALKDTGVTLCIENLFSTDVSAKREVPNFCSGGEELCDIIDTLNDMHGSHFAACLDTGHAALIGQDPAQLARTLGPRIKALHIHDNLGMEDDHLIPSRGGINWREFATALGGTGYNETFNFEVTQHFMDFPLDTYSHETFWQACNLLYAIGRSLADIAEEARRAQ